MWTLVFPETGAPSLVMSEHKEEQVFQGSGLMYGIRPEQYWKDQEYQGQTGHIQSCIQDSQAPTGLILTVPPQLPGLLPFRQVDGLMMHGFVGMGDVLPCHKILSGELLNFFNISVVNLII